MLFRPLDITIPHIAYACLGGFVVIFGMFSLFIREKLYIGEACWAFLFGVIIGPYGAGIFDPRGWGGNNPETTNQITLEVTRVVLAIGVFAIGVELPKAYMKKHWKSLFFLLGPVMTYGWFVSAGLIYALIPGLNFLSSLAVAACLTPTDPILAAAVVGGKYADKHVPAHIRYLLAAESGCNDGAAYPFLYIAIYLIIDTSTGRAVEDWFLTLWLYEIVFAVVFGAVLGFAFRHLMKFCERNDLIDRQSYVAQYLSLAMLTIGIMTMLGSDDLLAAFSCGTAFAWDGFFNRQTEESVFSSVIDLLFNVAAFVYVGAWMPFNDFTNETLTLSVWRLIVIGILVLLLKRLPIIIAMYKFIPDIKTFREAVFSGHFGPMGIGAVYISTLAAMMLPRPSDPPADQTEFLAATIQPIVAFMVLCSIAVHGLSIPSFSLGRRVHSVSSRTWSRHATGPDWTQQTRHVTRGEDIVINRDGDAVGAAERGDAGLSVDEKASWEERASKRASTSTSTPSPVKDNEDIAKEPINEEGSEATRAELEKKEDEEAMKEENLPQGDEILAEWKEGPDRIIERRPGGPGEEVEVEVVRNAYCSTGEEVRHAFRTKEGAAKQSARAYLDRLRHAQNNGHKELEHVENTVLKDAVALEHRAAEMLGMPDAHVPGEDVVQDDDDGWASDKSDGDASGNGRGKDRPSSVASSDSSPRPRSPGSPSRKKSRSGKSKPIGIGIGKRMRRRPTAGAVGGPSFSGNAHRLMVSPPSNEDVAEGSRTRPSTAGAEDDDRRGRSTILRPDSSHRNLSARHRRIESLRLDGATPLVGRSREASPTRSVRFADMDHPRSGTSTPRQSSFLEAQQSPTSPSSPSYYSAPTSPNEAGEDEDRRVTFDLPDQKP